MDSAALLGAAIRAAILAKAPRRTVQAVASAVTGVLVHSPAPGAASRAVPKAQATEGAVGAATAMPPNGSSAEELVAALREARRAQRRRKKANRRARKRSARETASETHMEDDDTREAGLHGMERGKDDLDDVRRRRDAPKRPRHEEDAEKEDEPPSPFRVETSSPERFFPELPRWMFDFFGAFKEGVREYNKRQGRWESYLLNEEPEWKRFGKWTVLTRVQWEEYAAKKAVWADMERKREARERARGRSARGTAGSGA